MHDIVPKHIAENRSNLPTLQEVRNIADQILPVIRNNEHYKCTRETMKMFYDYWENSTSVAGIRTMRIRVFVYHGTDPEIARNIVQSTMGDKHLREVVALLPEGSFKFYSWRRYDHTGLYYENAPDTKNNCLKVWYRTN